MSDDLLHLFDVVNVPCRHGHTCWRIVCKWDGSIIRDLSINGRPDNREAALKSLKGILARCQDPFKYHTEGKYPTLTEKIVEYLIFVK